MFIAYLELCDAAYGLPPYTTGSHMIGACLLDDENQQNVNLLNISVCCILDNIDGIDSEHSN